MENLNHYEELVNWHKRQIVYYDLKLQSDLTKTQIECYKRLKMFSQKAIAEYQENMRKILNGEWGR